MYFSEVESDISTPPIEGVFANIKKFSINTHCGEKSTTQTTPKNRIANELSPLREFHVYKMLELLSIPVQRTQLAQITYQNSKIMRYGLLIESSDALAARLGGLVVDTSPPENSTWAPGDDP